MTGVARLLAIVAVASTSALPLRAEAAPCAGFGDVDDSDPFCGNVQWVRNRQITLGCSVPGSYCPHEPVIRASMALFLQRMGLRLQPEFLAGSQGVNGPIDPAVVRCVVTPLNLPWPRIIEGIGAFSTIGNAGAADIAVQFVESTDLGVNWNPVSPLHAASVGDQGSANLVLLLGPRLLAASTQYLYALRISRVAGSSTTGNPANGSCRSLLSIGNRNPSTPPLDE